MWILLIFVVALIGLAAALAASALLQPRIRRAENLTQIENYGYLGKPAAAPKPPGRSTRKSLDKLAGSLGEFVARRLVNFREEEIQRELISAGFYRIGPRRFLGYRALAAILLPLVLMWLAGLGGSSLVWVVLFGFIGFAVGWLGPNLFLHRRAHGRLRTIDESLPALIDLLVVTLEAGVAFTQALRMASERISGPLGQEVRLTIQEQSLGLSMLEALENWARRCNTPAVRSFVRSMVQGDRLGVSIGQILRNQAVEMRARQKALIEERAQKAPVKILFPLVFLIFPAMFVIVLGPAMFDISKSLHG
jgi:tight adherence protein C